MTPPLPVPTAAVSADIANRVPWSWRVREMLTAYLPLLLMMALALSTWWLVKNTPKPEGTTTAVVPKHIPDYTMQHFSVERFSPDGSLHVRLEGEQMRHYPDTDTIEIDTVHVRTLGADGRVTLANARQAVANGDASEVQLIGGAHVVSQHAPDVPIEFDGDFIEAFTKTEQLHSHLPVQVRQGTSVLHAQGMDYDNLSRMVHLQGRVTADLAPAIGRRTAR